MITFVIVGISIVAGMVLVVGVAFALEEYRSWKYRWKTVREYRERPRIPAKIAKMVIHDSGDVQYPVWYVEAFDRKDVRVGTESGDHPMNAILNLVALTGKEPTA